MAAGGLHRPVVPASESFAVVGLLVFFLVINVFTATLSPTVWRDEVLYTDPAYRLAFTGEFTSAAWPNQPKDHFFAGDVPLHPVMLAGWIKLFGFSVTAVRSLDYLLVALAAWLAYRAVTRAGLLQTTTMRLLFVMLLLFGYGMGFGYREGRPDALAMFIAAAGAFALTLQPVTRAITLFLIAAIGPWAGLQLVPVTALALLAVLFSQRRTALGTIASVVLGMASGVAGLYFLYSSHGVWNEFLSNVLPHIGLGDPSEKHIVSFLSLYLHDLSLLPVLLVALGGIVFRDRMRATVSIALTIFALVIPVVVQIAGGYPVFYSWMAFAPAALAACMAADQLSKPAQLLPGLCFLAAGAVGLPARVALIGFQIEARDYRPIDQFVRDRTRTFDIVFCDFAAYYPARRLAREVYVWPNHTNMTADQCRDVTVVFATPGKDTPTAIREALGDLWQQVGPAYETSARLNGNKLHDWLAQYGAEKYHLAAYRRIERRGPR
ncbi:MAG: hypothetical protein ACJ8C4_19895 [Gemmataceae bacterium]